ncbi:MAG: SDR family oxidoreductase [Bacteroidales bacterium]|nr:SDR family oxidoreductase [Bacteroidales bacterium]
MIVFITGISSGFGLETAKLLSQQGYTVYGTARRNEDLPSDIYCFKVDVRDQESVEKAVAEIVEREGRIDVLINNAGMGIGGPLEFAAEEEIREQMDTNFMGLVHCVNAVLPRMRKKGSGRIIAISSIGGLMGLPFQGYYSASKFAVEGYCEALRLETKPFGITVTVIRPGDFATSFTTSRIKIADEAAFLTYPAYQKSIDKVEHDEANGLNPRVLARKISKVIQKKHPRYGYVVSSCEQHLSIILKRVLPDRWFAAILRKYYCV